MAAGSVTVQAARRSLEAGAPPVDARAMTLPRLLSLLLVALLAVAPAATARDAAVAKGPAKACKGQAGTCVEQRKAKSAAKAAKRACKTERRRDRAAFARAYGRRGGRAVAKCVAARLAPAAPAPVTGDEAAGEDGDDLGDEVSEDELAGEDDVLLEDEDEGEWTEEGDEPFADEER